MIGRVRAVAITRRSMGPFGYCDKFRMPQRIGEMRGCHKWRGERNKPPHTRALVAAVIMEAISIAALACIALQAARLLVAFAAVLAALVSSC